MMVLEPQSTRFWQEARRHQLMTEDELRACFEAIEPDKRTVEALERRLARKAVERGLLTVWQAQQLIWGRPTLFRVGKYVLLDRIGQGGMGRVYKAKDPSLDRLVALKMMTSDRMTNPRSVERFKREIRAGAQLEHDHIVRIYDGGTAEDGSLFLVMEYIDGPSVGSLIVERGRIEPRQAVRWTYEIALGLEYARLKGLVHRDVHPWNMLINPEGKAKLTDLGLAIHRDDLEGTPEGTGPKPVPVTRDGVTVGNFDYLSPEQARNSHAVDSRSDLYSLGCSLYHMLSGQVPFPVESLAEKLLHHQAREPEPLEDLVPDLPEGLGEVVRTLMRKKRRDRYETPALAAEALVPFLTATRPKRQGPAAGPRVAASINPTASVATRPAPTSTVPLGASDNPLDLGLRIEPEPIARGSSSSGGGSPAPSDGKPAAQSGHAEAFAPSPASATARPEAMAWARSSVNSNKPASPRPVGSWLWAVALTLAAALALGLAILVGGQRLGMNGSDTLKSLTTTTTRTDAKAVGPNTSDAPQAPWRVVTRSRGGELVRDADDLDAAWRLVARAGGRIELWADEVEWVVKEPYLVADNLRIRIQGRDGAANPPRLKLIFAGTPLFRVGDPRARIEFDHLIVETQVESRPPLVENLAAPEVVIIGPGVRFEGRDQRSLLPPPPGFQTTTSHAVESLSSQVVIPERAKRLPKESTPSAGNP